MSISLSHKLGNNADALRRLYSGDLPTNEDERWNMIDGPRYGLEQLIDEHERALSILAACQTNGRPFCLFLRNFSFESPDGFTFLAESSRFQGWLTGHLAVRNVPVIKLHGGSDAVIPIQKFNVNTGERPDRPDSDESGTLSTHAGNWFEIATELLAAASLTVLCISKLSDGVLREIGMLRSQQRMDRCLVAVMKSPRPSDEETRELQDHLVDFPHVFQSPDWNLLHVWEVIPILDQLIDTGRTEATFPHSLNTRCAYIEPAELASEDNQQAKRNIWLSIRTVRVRLRDEYWRAVVDSGIPIGPSMVDREWRLLHGLYSLAMAVGDFRAVSESLQHLALLYRLHGSLFTFNLSFLAKKYEELSERLGPPYTLDFEAKILDQPEAKPPDTPRGVREMTDLARRLASNGDRDAASTYYQLAFIGALHPANKEEPGRSATLRSILYDWANEQANAGNFAWAEVNFKFALAISRSLVAQFGKRFQPELARTMANLGAMYTRVGRHAEADSLQSQALDMRRELAQDDQAQLRDLAKGLASYADTKKAIGDHETAITLLVESLSIWRRVVENNPAAVTELTMYLVYVSLYFADVDNRVEGLKLAREAAGLLEAVKEYNPSVAKLYQSSVEAAVLRNEG
ncbi:MAG: tetratricopeptide repeat protein [Nitrospiraceae bacterium]